jgi:hypothetical protein
VMKAFSALAQSALAQGALDGKTKELIAIAIRSRFDATTVSPSTSRRRSITTRRARKSSKRWAWRSICERDLRRCTRATRSAPMLISRRSRRTPHNPKETTSLGACFRGPATALVRTPSISRISSPPSAPTLAPWSTFASRTNSPLATFRMRSTCQCRVSIRRSCRRESRLFWFASPADGPAMR